MGDCGGGRKSGRRASGQETSNGDGGGGGGLGKAQRRRRNAAARAQLQLSSVANKIQEESQKGWPKGQGKGAKTDVQTWSEPSEEGRRREIRHDRIRK